jgi:hypothetical protein
MGAAERCYRFERRAQIAGILAIERREVVEIVEVELIV